ncbi:MAG: 4a-hydroxytetrahydrobiopterin dehydratase [Alphaproteobacteria bacterium]
MKVDGWKIVSSGDAMERDFEFENFAEAWTFMCRVAAHAEAMDHHPEWTNIYNRVHIRLTTHDMAGLSKLDQELAEKINSCIN